MAEIKKGKKKTFIGTATTYTHMTNCAYIPSDSRTKNGEYPQIHLEDQNGLLKDGKKYKITIERLK